MIVPGHVGCRAALITPDGPGAIAIFALVGDVEPVLTALTGRTDWPIARKRLTDVAGVDEGVVVRVDPRRALIMPHGGMRITRLLAAKFREFGVDVVPPGELNEKVLYPEAEDRVEALMLATISRAASPSAIDLLLEQPRRWRVSSPLERDEIERSERLNHLINPPTVVLAGWPNVGKSTLTNALFGREVSIDLDLPGTTRDYTSGLLDLGGVVVQWCDTAGLRPGADSLERRSVARTRELLSSANLVVAMTDHEQEWPELPARPDLRVAGKADLGSRTDADVALSAMSGFGLELLITRVRDLLVRPEDLAAEGRWVFDAEVEAAAGRS